MDAAAADWPPGTKNEAAARPHPGLLATCANPGCRSGWLHLLRSRTAPVFEGGWCCSAECTRALVAAAVRREFDGRGATGSAYRHRIPLGLVMLEQGWITSQQLRQALEAQKAAGAGRLGTWLVHQQGVSEHLVTRALAVQWSCPVFSLDGCGDEGLAALVPRLFVDAFGALPLRLAAGKLLYLGFEDRPDPVLALAIARMHGIRVEAGVVESSLFGPAHTRLLGAQYPETVLAEASNEAAAIALLARAVERVHPAQARLVRVHDCLWLRCWRRVPAGALPEPGQVRDVICSLGVQ
jgi:hypothetical protein